jgi:hypothetical protein
MENQAQWSYQPLKRKALIASAENEASPAVAKEPFRFVANFISGMKQTAFSPEYNVNKIKKRHPEKILDAALV